MTTGLLGSVALTAALWPEATEPAQAPVAPPTTSEATAVTEQTPALQGGETSTPRRSLLAQVRLPAPTEAQVEGEPLRAPETPGEAAPARRDPATELASRLQREERDPRWAAEQERLLLIGLQAAPGVSVEETVCAATVCRARLNVTEQADLRTAVGAVEWAGPRYVDVDRADPRRVVAYFSRPDQPVLNPPPAAPAGQPASPAPPPRSGEAAAARAG